MNKLQETPVICPYCNIKAKLVSGYYIHPSKKKYRNRRYYLCEDCGAYVGCHKGSDKALGTPANEELRGKRIQTHLFLDSLWRGKKLSRRNAYVLLSKKLDIALRNCHIGEFGLEMCEKAIEAIKRIKNENRRN